MVYERVAEQVHNGTWSSDDYWGGIGDGVVGLAPYSDLVPQEVRDLAEAKKALIVAGGWDVFTGPINDQGGEILVANVVRELAEGKEFMFGDRGETALRGFDDPVRLFEVRWREAS